MELRVSTKQDELNMLSLSRKQMEPYFFENALNWNAAEREELLNQSELICIVESSICGYLQLYQNEHELFIYDLQLFPEFQNLGLGTKIINRVKEIAQERKLSAVRLGSFKSNPAIKLYARLGFNSIKENNYFVWYKCSIPHNN